MDWKVHISSEDSQEGKDKYNFYLGDQMSRQVPRYRVWMGLIYGIEQTQGRKTTSYLLIIS